MYVPLHINYHFACDPRPNRRVYDRQEQALLNAANKLSQITSATLQKALQEAGCSALEIPVYIGLEPFSQVIDDTYMNFWFMAPGEFMVTSADRIMHIWTDETIAQIDLCGISSQYTRRKRISIEMRGESGVVLGLQFISL